MAEADPIQRLNAALEGRYRIERELGAGGMATVYLAEDVRHRRNVALKVLKPELAAVVGSNRFLAEIETTANLQHPHILPLFDSGEADGFLFYVMPYVKGESLRDRLDREHQLPVDDAVRIAANLAEALDYAHRQGVIHRDMKPANVLLQDGKPVISDFGIAFAVSAGGRDRLTETGLSLGTPHYMSPEQATGDLNVVPATDIYALGCVLYEMLVGEPPFTGSTLQAVLGKIITGEIPSAKAERASVPANVDAVIAKALEKIPADRFGGAAAFSSGLTNEGFRHHAASAVVGSALPAWRHSSFAFGVGAGVLLAAILGMSWWQFRTPAEVASDPTLIPTYALATNQMPLADFEPGPADMGVVYRPALGDGLWYRPWNERHGAQIPGTEGAESYFISPDGRTLIFGYPRKIMTLPDGVPRNFPDVPGRMAGIGADGYLYLDDDGLTRTPLAGGQPERLLSRLDGETRHEHATLLPGHRALLFTVWAGEPESPTIYALDLTTMERSRVTEGRWQYYSEPTGHIVYSTLDRRLMAIPFDAKALRTRGPPTEVTENVLEWGFESTHRLTPDGRLMYWEAGEGLNQYEFVWADQSGNTTAVESGWIINPGEASAGWSLSPGDSMIAWREIVEGVADVWVRHLRDGDMYAVTSDPEPNHKPRWSPTGNSLVYRSPREQGPAALFEVELSDTGAPRLLADYEWGLLEGTWGPAGEWLLARANVQTGRDIVGFRPAVDEEVRPILADPGYDETEPHLSPDGRWLAYVSDEGGNNAVYVRPFPSVSDNVWRISRAGGIQPRWSGDGSELFFLDPATRTMVVAQIDASSGFRWTLEELFALRPDVMWHPRRDFYDVTEDGQRFLFARALESEEATLVVITGFHEVLKRLVPN